MKKSNNMYNRSVKQWNPFVGCKYHCSYCKKSFQRQIKRWAKNKCNLCYHFVPHLHEERLNQKLPRTSPLQFIFVSSSGDISFCNKENFNKILDVIKNNPSKNFLLQSKNPSFFDRFGTFPENVILGTTLETNIQILTNSVSYAPSPEYRWLSLIEVPHYRRMLSIEPIMKFDMNILLEWVITLNPEFVYVGYDTVGSFFPQPKIKKTLKLVETLRQKNIDVICKNMSVNFFNK